MPPDEPIVSMPVVEPPGTGLAASPRPALAVPNGTATARAARWAAIASALPALLDFLPDLIAIHEDGRYVYINAGGARLLGAQSPSEVLGRRIEEFVAPAQRQPLATILHERARLPADTPPLEYTLVRVDGRVLHLETKGVPLTLDGRPARLLMARDVTARKQADLELAAILDGAPDALLIIDDQHHYIGANRAAEQLTGYTRAELLQLRPADLTRLPDAELTSTRVRQAGPGATLTNERDLYRKDGAAIPVETHASTAVLPGGDSVVVVALRDLTARKALERHLITAEKLNALGQLAAGVAHDINNTLGAVLGPAQLAREALAAGTAQPEQLAADLALIEQAAQDVAGIVQRLQRFARGRAGAEQPPEPVAPDALLDDVVALSRARWRDQARLEGRRLRVRVERDGAPQVLADATELKEVLLNFVHNAADASPDGGVITISARTSRQPSGGAEAVLAVTDTGVGMDAQTRSRLFEPFFTTKPAGKGTGLGMPMAQAIVQRLGGRIEVDSALGRGTTVRLHLPVAPTASPPPTALETPAATALDVIVVEDEIGLRGVAARILQRGGCRVVGVGTAEEALALLDGGSACDVVVTDVGLPGRSGWDLAAALRERTPPIGVLVATGWAHSLPDEQLAEHGVRREQLLGKPYRAEELLAAVARVAGGT